MSAFVKQGPHKIFPGAPAKAEAPVPTPATSSVKCPDCKGATKVAAGMRSCLDGKCGWWTIVPQREQQIP